MTDGDAKERAWKKTRVQGMYRHSNGNYYARTFRGKGEKWHSHRTKDFSVAKIRHEKHMAEQRAQTVGASSVETWRDAEALFLLRMNADPELKESSRHYKRQVLRSLKQDWPGLEQMPLRRISRTDCANWAARHGERASSTRYNAAVGILRAILTIGVEGHAIAVNPADGLKRHSVRPDKPQLPNRAQFLAVLDAMRSAKGRFSKACADFVAGLAYTGMRLNEAVNLRWQDVELGRGRIHVTGGEGGTKNRKTRYVPLIPEAAELFLEMRERAMGERVFRVREAQKSLDRATESVGAPRITHHDLRDLFATSCIESGVNIPTVAGWLGHQDGGALLMKVYGHLRDEHSIAEAKRVSFAPRESAQPRTSEP